MRRSHPAPRHETCETREARAARCDPAVTMFVYAHGRRGLADQEDQRNDQPGQADTTGKAETTDKACECEEYYPWVK